MQTKQLDWPTPQRHQLLSLLFAAACCCKQTSSTPRRHGSRAGCPVCPLFRPLTTALCALTNAPAAEQSVTSWSGSRHCLKEASCKHHHQPHDLAMRCLCSLQQPPPSLCAGHVHTVSSMTCCFTCSSHLLGAAALLHIRMPGQPTSAHGVRHEGGALGWRRATCGKSTHRSTLNHLLLLSHFALTMGLVIHFSHVHIAHS
jgi:hypothetical protein